MDTPVSALLQDMLVGAADNRLEEQNHATATHLQTCTAVNSKRAYDPKVVEFMNWLKANYPDRPDEITNDNIHRFLCEQVQNRPLRKKGRKRKLADGGNEQENEQELTSEGGEHVGQQSLSVQELLVPAPNVQTCGYSLLEQYSNAIVHFWKSRHTSTGSIGPAPVRPELVNQLLKNKKKLEMESQNKPLEDRGKGTMIEEIPDHAFTDVCNAYWKENSEDGLKFRAIFMMSYGVCSRGDQLRNLYISDIGVKFFSEEGHKGAHLFRTVWRKSKKNLKETGMLRHMDVRECPFGAIALYFFVRFTSSRTPDFSEKTLWYDIWAFEGRKEKTQLTFTAQHKKLKEKFKELDISTYVITQTGRKRTAGISASSGDKNGGCSPGSRNGAHTKDSIPWEAVRCSAGFGPERNKYYVPRANVEPPATLFNRIFPDFAREKVKFENSEDSMDLAGNNFFELIDYMRRIILQDAAVLLTFDEFKTHKIFQNDIFKSSEFLDFQKRLLRECESYKTPETLELQGVVPAISQELSEIKGYSISLKGQMFEMDERVAKIMEEKDERIAKMGSDLSEIRTILEKFLSGLGKLENEMLIGNEMQSSSQTQSSSQSTQQKNNSKIIDASEENFIMDRKINSVRAAWLEYIRYIAPLLENKKAWQRAESETRFLNRRKPLFAAMHQLLDVHGMTMEDACNFLEGVRPNKTSLRKLCDLIAEKRKVDKNFNIKELLLSDIDK